MLTCKNCGDDKDEKDFVKIKGKVYHECKDCRNKYINQYRRDIRSGKREKLNNEIVNGKKTCRICKKPKKISLFKKRNDTEQGYRNECKSCVIKKMNEYYQKTYNEVRRNRKKTDPTYKLIANHRLYLYKCVKKNKLIKSNKSIDYLGCDILFLKEWLEFQFDDKMTWENYGNNKYWTIDHIIPLSLFDFSDKKNEKIAFHWTNLQPLTDNFSKSNKIRMKDFVESGKKAMNFLDKKNNFNGYQNIFERICWLREKLR